VEGFTVRVAATKGFASPRVSQQEIESAWVLLQEPRPTKEEEETVTVILILNDLTLNRTFGLFLS
jgi:hypothetical protein